MAIQWRPDLAIGVELVDKQHQELFARVNSLLAAMGQGKGRDEVGKTVGFLQSYVVTHFRDEEKLMAERAYPDLAAHRAQHAAFVADFTGLKQSLESGGDLTGLTIQVQRRVGDWLVNHVSKTDKAIGEYLRTRGTS